MAEEAPFAPRDLLGKYFGKDPRLLAMFEEQALAVQAATETLGAIETAKLPDASYVTLSPNKALTNEFLLAEGDGIEVSIGSARVTVSVDKTVARVTSFSVEFGAPAHVKLGLPVDGVLVSDTTPAKLFNKTLDKPALSGLVNASSDSAAAAAGVAVGGIYREGSALRIRVA